MSEMEGRPVISEVVVESFKGDPEPENLVKRTVIENKEEK